MKAFASSCFILLVAAELQGITVTGYDPAKHDRFSSGFPLSPVANSDSNFVGAGLDFSGVGWSTTIPGGINNNSYKGLGMLSPRHFLTAQHFEYQQVANQDTRGIRIRQKDGTTTTAEGVTSINNLALGVILSNGGIVDYDLAIGTLDNAIAPAQNFSRLAVLDLYDTSSDDTKADAVIKYGGLPIFLYGRASTANGSPRAAATSVFDFFDNGGDTDQRLLMTDQNDAAFVLGDSASPTLYRWSNPNGTDELSILGVNSLLANLGGTVYNFASFFARPNAIAGAQAAMNPAGFALRSVGDPDYTWVGNSSTRIDRNAAWGVGGSPTSAGDTADKYVLFDANAASSTSATVQANYELRGLYFKQTVETGDGFNFSGSSTLTIGRGGITNYDNDAQVFTNNIALGAPQYWSIEDGSVTLSDLNTNGQLLETAGSGDVTISGAVSGSGGLAVSEGTLTLSSSSSYTGATWAHGGSLIVNGDIAASSTLTISSFATLKGYGSIPKVLGEGTLSPGSSPGILTAESIDATDGLDFDFEFTGSAPIFETGSSSVNDLIRISGATPFTVPLDPDNRVRIFLDTGAIANGQTFNGGFYTDQSADFIGSIANGAFEIYVADGSGSVNFGGQTYELFDGPFLLSLSTEAQTADFGQGKIAGRIMRLTAEPDLSQYAGWKLFHSLSGNDALDNADTDGDNIDQLQEFALGGDPNVRDPSVRPTHAAVEDSGNLYLELSITRPIGLQGISYTPQTTDDPDSWPTDSTGIVNDSPIPVNNGDGTETLTYRRAQPITPSANAFIRLKIAESP
ncbi:MAG: hypothetical protein ACON4O_08335 [Lentimonas sp.]